MANYLPEHPLTDKRVIVIHLKVRPVSRLNDQGSLTRNETSDLQQSKTIRIRVSRPLRRLRRPCHKVRSISRDRNKETIGQVHGVHCHHPVHRPTLPHREPMQTLPQPSTQTFRTLTVIRRRLDSAHDVLLHFLSYNYFISFTFPFEYCFPSFDSPLFVVYHPAYLLTYLCDEKVSHHPRYTLA